METAGVRHVQGESESTDHVGVATQVETTNLAGGGRVRSDVDMMKSAGGCGNAGEGSTECCEQQPSVEMLGGE